jgi:hypothetical protein
MEAFKYISVYAQISKKLEKDTMDKYEEYIKNVLK